MTALQTVPCLPDNSPFSPEQRAWLNGFLAGMYSSAPVSAAVAPTAVSLRVAVLYATQSGTSEGLARKIAKELKSQGHVPVLSSLEGYAPAALAAERYALLIASTYGEGEAPEPAQPFYEQLCLEHFPKYENLTYAVLALGDSHYEQFCRFGVDLDARLASLGANRLCDRMDVDIDVDAPFAHWKQTILQRLRSVATGDAPPAISPQSAMTSAPQIAAAMHTRENPALAPLVDKRRLTADVSSKTTLHLAFSTEGTDLHYEAGDACGVLPQNDPSLVQEILNVLKLTGQEVVDLPQKGSLSLEEALLHHLQITRLSRRLLESYAAHGDCRALVELLKPDQQSALESYVHERGFIDLVEEFPGVLESAEQVVATLPRLAPRLYSISSSPAAHSGQVHATVAVVRYSSNNRERGGVCSTLFADRAALGDRLPLYIQPNKRFRLPKDGAAPLIMIGPGTGVAPFRSFLHERKAVGAKGRNWLFFGERTSATDFLYREELESMRANGHLTRLDTAFSRDQDRKVYVQDRMLEQAPLLWSWLQDGASVYVCGDASRMAKDVERTLHTIVRQQGSMEPELATEYLQELKEQQRYQKDVY